MLNKVFQSNISCPRAAASCLPGVGPFLNFHNIVETRLAIQNFQVKAQLDVAFAGFQAGNRQIKADLAALSGSREALETADQEEQEAIDELSNKPEELKKTFIELLNKGIDYSKCGIVSNLLTVAAAVTLLALGILSLPIGISLVAGCGFLALGNYVGLSAFKKNLDEFEQQVQEESSAPPREAHAQ